VVDRPEDLVAANAKLAVGSSVVTSIAAVIGAGLYKGLGSRALLWVDVVLFAACAVLALRIPAPTRELGHTLGEPEPAPVSDQAGAGSEDRSRSLLPAGGLALAAVPMAAMRGMAGLMTALVVFAFRREGAPLIWYGLVGVASVAGNLGGAALAPILRGRVREERLIVACALAIGGAAVVATQLDWVQRRPAALLLGVSVGLGASIAKLAFDALVQRDTPSITRSRLFARTETAFQLAWVLAALIPVLIPMSLLVGFILVAAATLGGAAFFTVGLHRARRGMLPHWWPGAQKAVGNPPAPVDPPAAGPPIVPGIVNLPTDPR
jgi:hypothetical protein